MIGVLYFTEALTGAIYEIELSAIDTIGETAWDQTKLDGENPGIHKYNITAANPRFKQFHMDIALHGDYMYFTDLKNNAVERFNWKKAKTEGEKGLKVEQYGPAEFYSLIYMYAVTEETLATVSSGANCEACLEKHMLCLSNGDPGKEQCSCYDNFEPADEGQNCVQISEEFDYVIENCPKNTQQSAPQCRSTLSFPLWDHSKVKFITQSLFCILEHF